MTIFNGSLSLPAAADMHVHVRDGAMLDLVAPTIRQGGVNTVFVMFVPCWRWSRLMALCAHLSQAQPGSSHHNRRSMSRIQVPHSKSSWQ